MSAHQHSGRPSKQLILYPSGIRPRVCVHFSYLQCMLHAPHI